MSDHADGQTDALFNKIRTIFWGLDKRTEVEAMSAFRVLRKLVQNGGLKFGDLFTPIHSARLAEYIEMKSLTASFGAGVTALEEEVGALESKVAASAKIRDDLEQENDDLENEVYRISCAFYVLKGLQQPTPPKPWYRQPVSPVTPKTKVERQPFSYRKPDEDIFISEARKLLKSLDETSDQKAEAAYGELCALLSSRKLKIVDLFVDKHTDGADFENIETAIRDVADRYDTLNEESAELTDRFEGLNAQVLSLDKEIFSLTNSINASKSKFKFFNSKYQEELKNNPNYFGSKFISRPYINFSDGKAVDTWLTNCTPQYGGRLALLGLTPSEFSKASAALERLLSANELLGTHGHILSQVYLNGNVLNAGQTLSSVESWLRRASQDSRFADGVGIISTNLQHLSLYKEAVQRLLNANALRDSSGAVRTHYSVNGVKYHKTAIASLRDSALNFITDLLVEKLLPRGIALLHHCKTVAAAKLVKGLALLRQSITYAVAKAAKGIASFREHTARAATKLAKVITSFRQHTANAVIKFSKGLSLFRQYGRRPAVKLGLLALCGLVFFGALAKLTGSSSQHKKAHAMSSAKAAPAKAAVPHIAKSFRVASLTVVRICSAPGIPLDAHDDIVATCQILLPERTVSAKEDANSPNEYKVTLGEFEGWGAKESFSLSNANAAPFAGNYVGDEASPIPRNVIRYVRTPRPVQIALTDTKASLFPFSDNLAPDQLTSSVSDTVAVKAVKVPRFWVEVLECTDIYCEVATKLPGYGSVYGLMAKNDLTKWQKDTHDYGEIVGSRPQFSSNPDYSPH